MGAPPISLMGDELLAALPARGRTGRERVRHDGRRRRGRRRNWRLVRADTDAVPPSVRRFMARARQRRLRAALPWAVGAGVLLVVGGLIWMVYGTPVLGVREVEVIGTDGADAGRRCEQAAAVPAGSPLARVDLDAVRDRVQALAAVDRATVSRGWPGTVRGRGVERTPVAAVRARRAAFALIDAEGVAFRTVARRPAGLPLAAARRARRRTT